MNGFSILMLAFAILIFLCGLYLYTGHKSKILLWKGKSVNKMSLQEIKNVGKWTIISSFLLFLLAIIGLLLDI